MKVKRWWNSAVVGGVALALIACGTPTVMLTAAPTAAPTVAPTVKSMPTSCPASQVEISIDPTTVEAGGLVNVVGTSRYIEGPHFYLYVDGEAVADYYPGYYYDYYQYTFEWHPSGPGTVHVAIGVFGGLNCAADDMLISDFVAVTVTGQESP